MKITCGIYLYNTLIRKILICHATRARWNMWSIPKGLADGESDHFAVARREMCEETGIVYNKLSVVMTQRLPSVKYQRQNKVLESFLIVTDSDLGDHKFTSNVVPGAGVPEVDSWKWVSLEEAKRWLHESQVKQLDVIREVLRET